MARTNGNGFNVELCKALGLEPNTVASLTVKLQYGEYAVVTAEMFISDEAAAVIKRYRLNPELVEEANDG